jgi:hypothetical protein
VREGDIRTRVNMRKYYVLMCENGKWDLLKLFQEWGGGGKEEGLRE